MAADHTLHRQPAASRPRGVALVLAGLNVAPGRMQAIADQLAGAGYETLVCALFGHGANFPAGPHAQADAQADAEVRLAAMRRASYRLWRDEVRAAQRIARLRAEQLGGVPVALAAFSLGALIGCNALLAEPPGAQPLFDRLLLFAPALSIRCAGHLLRPLVRWPALVIPSATPLAYRANRGTAMAAYAALYAALADFSTQADARLNLPTLLFCDPQDELVSYAGLERLLARRKLARWTLHPVHKGPDAGTRYHHLLIDEWSVGRVTWAGMAAAMRAHLSA